MKKKQQPKQPYRGGEEYHLIKEYVQLADAVCPVHERGYKQFDCLCEEHEERCRKILLRLSMLIPEIVVGKAWEAKEKKCQIKR